MREGVSHWKGLLALVLLVIGAPGVVIGILWTALAAGFAFGCAFVDEVATLEKRKD